MSQKKPSETLEEFLSVLNDLIVYVESNIPNIDQKKVSVLKIKLETATEFAPKQLCETLYKKLKPFAHAIYQQDETVILEHFKEIPILRHFDLETVWPSTPDSIKKNLWQRLLSIFTLATIAMEEIGQIPAGTIIPPNMGDSGDMQQLTAQISSAMPMIFQMLGPMLSNMNAPQQPQSQPTRERLRKKVQKKNQLNNLY